jgi:hypothetical protein
LATQWGQHLPVYNPLGGPQGKAHVTFDHTKSQYLDAGPRADNVFVMREGTTNNLQFGIANGESWNIGSQ